MKYIVSLLVLALPVVTFAQDIQGGIDTIGEIIAALIPIGIGLALITFIWGILKYVIAKDEEGQKEARSVMIYGVIALFVIVSVWGLVGLIGNTFGIDQGGNVETPSVPGL